MAVYRPPFPYAAARASRRVPLGSVVAVPPEPGHVPTAVTWHRTDQRARMTRQLLRAAMTTGSPSAQWSKQ